MQTSTRYSLKASFPPSAAPPRRTGVPVDLGTKVLTAEEFEKAFAFGDFFDYLTAQRCGRWSVGKDVAYRNLVVIHLPREDEDERYVELESPPNQRRRVPVQDCLSLTRIHFRGTARSNTIWTILRQNWPWLTSLAFDVRFRGLFAERQPMIELPRLDRLILLGDEWPTRVLENMACPKLRTVYAPVPPSHPFYRVVVDFIERHGDSIENLRVTGPGFDLLRFHQLRKLTIEIDHRSCSVFLRGPWKLPNAEVNVEVILGDLGCSFTESQSAFNLNWMTLHRRMYPKLSITVRDRGSGWFLPGCVLDMPNEPVKELARITETSNLFAASAAQRRILLPKQLWLNNDVVLYLPMKELLHGPLLDVVQSDQQRIAIHFTTQGSVPGPSYFDVDAVVHFDGSRFKWFSGHEMDDAQRLGKHRKPITQRELKLRDPLEAAIHLGVSLCRTRHRAGFHSLDHVLVLDNKRLMSRDTTLLPLEFLKFAEPKEERAIWVLS